MPAKIYGNHWQELRRRMYAVLTPGTPCRRCHLPMWPGRQPLDLGHPTDGYTTIEFEHASCNRRAGAINGNRSRHRKPGSGRRW